MFSLASLPSNGDLLVLTDELSSPADFLIHRIVSTHLKEAREPKCLFLSVSESLARLKAILGKSVSSVVCKAVTICSSHKLQYTQSDSFFYIDVGSRVGPPIKAQGPSPNSLLRPLLDLTRKKVTEWSNPESNILVVLDDISTLEWIGFQAADLLRFIRALAALCRKVSQTN